MDGGPFMQLEGIPTPFTSITLVILCKPCIMHLDTRSSYAVDEALAWMLKYSVIAFVRSPVVKKS